MTDIHTKFIDLSQLRIGMFVYLDVGWMDHPFPVSNFKISNQSQIDTLRSLGLERIRYSPDKSTLPVKEDNSTPLTDKPVELIEKIERIRKSEHCACVVICWRIRL